MSVGNFDIGQCSGDDFHPFGMLQPGRSFSSPSYRYGFQGQEKDDEVKGSGNSLNYKYRMHDARIGRFFAVDPLTSKYPHYSPYSFSGNKLIHAIELEGLEEIELSTNEVIHGPYSNESIEEYENYVSSTSGDIMDWNTWFKKEINTENKSELSIDEPFERTCTNCDDFIGQKNLVGEEVYVTTSVSFELEDIGVGDAEGISEFIPIYGSGRNAINDFQNGRYVTGVGNTIMLISDIFLIKSLVTSSSRVGISALKDPKRLFGINMSHNYGASVSRWKRLGVDMTGFKHHWLISQKMMTKYPKMKIFGNQLWNIKRFPTQQAHMVFAHGQTYMGKSFNLWKAAYPITSTPLWFKTGVVSGGGRLVPMFGIQLDF